MTQQMAIQPATQKGVILLEALIAILIFSMGILAVVGLQAAMVRNTADAQYRAEASYIAQQSLGVMWANPSNISSYNGVTDISARLPNGTLTVISTSPPLAAGQAQVIVNWQLPGDPQVHNVTADARIVGGD